MTELLAALSGALLVGGVLLLVAGLRAVPVVTAEPRTPPGTGRWARISRRTKIVAVAATGAGLAVAVLTGWVIALPLFPVAALGLPWLLGDTGEGRTIARLEGLAEWTRNLAGVIRVGAGLERALVDTLRTTPPIVHPEVSALVSRLRSQWDTQEALRQFAADFDDATGDLVAATLVLASRTRADGLGAILDGLAQTVAAEVSTRRQLEADRAKPAQTARLVTIITSGALGVLALGGQYLEPYRATPEGQLILALLISLYAALLVLIRKMSTVKPLPRFFTQTGPTT
jgi:Flp pilus assembly protein TadB|nr:hypothetical protein [Propionibacterium sp.]